MADNIGKISKEGQASLVKYCNVVLNMHNRQEDLRNKLEVIDIAYARYKACAEADPTGNGGSNGVDTNGAGDECCGVNADDITVPIVVSQVDSYVSYLNDVFLSGYPIFPVVATPDTILEAEKLQAIVDDHAVRGRYQRHLALNFKDAVKYNLSAIEVDWCALDLYNVVGDYMTPTKPSKIDQSSYYINKLNSTDMYNVIMDSRVLPVEIPIKGEFCGYIELISRIELKRKLAYYEKSGNGYHTAQAMESQLGNVSSAASNVFGYYREKPQISDLINKSVMRNGTMLDWVGYLTEERKKSGTIANLSDVYEHVTLYARIIPEEHAMGNMPKKGTPQVWKLCFVNHEKLVYAKRIFTIYDTLPMYFAQPLEDGFGYQTKSSAEGGIPFQEADSKLFSIRMNAARRAIVDRALYDAAALNSNDVNSPFPAAKIPFKANALIGGKTIDTIYKSIPFDSRGTETVVQDMAMIAQMADDMNGINKPQRGQFQKGNKSRKEWDDTMAGSYGRMRNCGLLIEYQQLLPIKEQIKLNIFQGGVSGSFQNQTSGQTYDIKPEDLEKLRKVVNNFKLADGLLPADKIASTDVLAQGIQMLSSSQFLQQAFGPMLPKMFLYLLNIGGVRNLEQFAPTEAQQPAPQAGGNTPAPQQPRTPAPEGAQ